MRRHCHQMSNQSSSTCKPVMKSAQLNSPTEKLSPTCIIAPGCICALDSSRRPDDTLQPRPPCPLDVWNINDAFTYLLVCLSFSLPYMYTTVQSGFCFALVFHSRWCHERSRGERLWYAVVLYRPIPSFERLNVCPTYLLCPSWRRNFVFGANLRCIVFSWLIL